MTAPCYNTAMRKTVTALLLTLLLTAPASAAITRQQAVNVWQEVSKPTELSALPFGFEQSSTPNAWVTAGKSVTVTTSLLELLDTEDELYCVLAHEAGHVKLNHMKKAAARQVGASIITSIARSLFGSITGAAASIGTTLATAGYSREQEIEADDYALTLAFEHGRNPDGLYSALTKLSKVHKTQASGFNSHPPDDRRLLHIKNSMAVLRADSIPDEIPKQEPDVQPKTAEKQELDEYFRQIQEEYKENKQE